MKENYKLEYWIQAKREFMRKMMLFYSAESNVHKNEARSSYYRERKKAVDEFLLQF